MVSVCNSDIREKIKRIDHYNGMDEGTSGVTVSVIESGLKFNSWIKLFAFYIVPIPLRKGMNSALGKW